MTRFRSLMKFWRKEHALNVAAFRRMPATDSETLATVKSNMRKRSRMKAGRYLQSLDAAAQRYDQRPRYDEARN